MRRHLHGAAVILLALALSGCFGDGDAARAGEARKFGSAAPAPKFASPVEEALGVHTMRAPREELGGWWILPASAGPDGVLSAFRWGPPKGSVIGLPGVRSQGVVLEVAPVVVNGTAPESWCLFGFAKAEGKLRALRPIDRPTNFVTFTSNAPIHCESATTTVNRTITQTGGAPSAPFVAPTTNRPFLIQLDLTDANQNETYWVLAAKHAEPVPFGIAFRTFAELPPRGAKAAVDAQEFVSGRGGLRPYPVKVAATGTGFQHVVYLGATRLSTELNTPGLVSTDVRTGPLKVTERFSVDPRPAGSTRDVTYESAVEKPGGWSMTWGSYASSCSVGRWDAAAKLGGSDNVARGIVWYPDLCTLTYGAFGRLALGFPVFIFGGEGPGDARSTFSLQYASATLEETRFAHFGMGSTLQQLFGIPAAPYKYAGVSLAGNVPP